MDCHGLSRTVMDCHIGYILHIDIATEKFKGDEMVWLSVGMKLNIMSIPVPRDSRQVRDM